MTSEAFVGSGDHLLREAARGNVRRLRALRARAAAGEPAPYVAGFFHFRGRRFRIDARAYITDPEVTHLIDVVGQVGERLEAQLGRPLRVLEFGVGAGTLAITIKHEHPSWTVEGVDVDPDALAVAAQNIREHHVDVELVLSDYFCSWPLAATAPDLIFGDPPWGGDNDVYAADRPASYYRWMPAVSAFAPGASGCGAHDELIAHVRNRNWSSLLVLNYGVLPSAVVAASAARLHSHELRTPCPTVKVVIGRAVNPVAPR